VDRKVEFEDASANCYKASQTIMMAEEEKRTDHLSWLVLPLREAAHEGRVGGIGEDSVSLGGLACNGGRNGERSGDDEVDLMPESEERGDHLLV
jgi:hypothetical protein